MMKHKLLFICGFPSGGTDLTKTVLNAHPDINVSGEMPFLVDLLNHGYDKDSRFRTLKEIENLRDKLKSSNAWGAEDAYEYDFSQLLNGGESLSLNDVMSHMIGKDGSAVWGNKTPQNTEQMLRLNRLFPEAQFLIVTRDVRDNSLSWSKKWGKSMFWCADKWNKRMRQGVEDSQTLAEGRTKFIKFEDLLSNPEVTCRGICSFLELSFSEQMLEHHKHTNESVDGKLNYGKALKADNKNKWKAGMSTQKAQRIEEIAFDSMRLLGYQPQTAKTGIPISTFELLAGKLNDIYALLFVGNRARKENTFSYRLKNVIHEVRKRLGKGQ